MTKDELKELESMHEYDLFMSELLLARKHLNIAFLLSMNDTIKNELKDSSSELARICDILEDEVVTLFDKN